jgi:hypothetical protein
LTVYRVGICFCLIRALGRQAFDGGAWADSSSWNGVVDLLLKDGYDVRALPNTLRGLSADAAVISTYLKSVPGPVVLRKERSPWRKTIF